MWLAAWVACSVIFNAGLRGTNSTTAWPGLACLGRVELIGKVSEFTIALGEPVRVRALSQSSQMSRSRYEPGRGREGWWRVVIACGLSRTETPFHEGSAVGCHGKLGIFMIYI